MVPGPVKVTVSRAESEAPITPAIVFVPVDVVKEIGASVI